MEWLVANLGTVAGWILTMATIILTVARNLWLTSQLKTDMEADRKNQKETNKLLAEENKLLRQELVNHIAAPSLHRTTDSEARLTRIENFMAEMNTKLDRLLGQKLGGN